MITARFTAQSTTTWENRPTEVGKDGVEVEARE